jgi:hypothetical protein
MVLASVNLAEAKTTDRICGGDACQHCRTGRHRQICVPQVSALGHN